MPQSHHSQEGPLPHLPWGFHFLFLGSSLAQCLPTPRKESPTGRMTMSLPWPKVCNGVTSSQPTSDGSLTCGEQFSTSSDPPGSEKPYLKAAFQHLPNSAPLFPLAVHDSDCYVIFPCVSVSATLLMTSVGFQRFCFCKQCRSYSFLYIFYCLYARVSL